MKFLIPVLGNASLIFADGNNDCPKECPAPKRECKTVCKEKCEPCPTKKICKTTCVEIRPKPPCECVTRACDCGVDFFITADFTWWKARQDGMEFAVTEPCNQGLTASGAVGVNRGCGALLVDPPCGKVYNTHSNYKPGFKVGVGFDFCDWGWDMVFNYTWFRSDHHHHHHNTNTATPGSGLLLMDAYWFVGMPFNQGPGIYNEATSKWNLRMNVLDWEMGRKFWIGKHIMFRPYAGLKGVWNRQHLKNTYTGYLGTVGNVLNGVPLDGYVDMFGHIKNDGVGIRAGMDGAWHFSRGFSFIGNYALTALWQRFKVSRRDQVTNSANVELGYPVCVSDKHYMVTPVFEWMLGLKWEGWSCGDNYHYWIRAAWEEQVWMDQNRFIRLPGTAKPSGDSDLSLQGLTLGIGFEF